MKKLLIVLALLLCCGTISAQFKKGDWQLSGSYTADFTKTHLDDDTPGTSEKVYVYRLSPSIERFVSDRFSVSLSPFFQESNYRATLRYRGMLDVAHVEGMELACSENRGLISGISACRPG